MNLNANVGGWDRGLRLIIGVVLIILGLAGVFSGTIAILAYVVAAILLITGLITFCPLNALLGLNTRKQAETSSPDEPVENSGH